MPDLLISVAGVNMVGGGAVVFIANAVASNGAMAPVVVQVPPSQSAAQINNAVRDAAVAEMAARGVIVGGGDVVTLVGGAV